MQIKLSSEEIARLQMGQSILAGNTPTLYTLKLTEEEIARLQLGMFALAEHLADSPHQADKDMLGRVRELNTKLETVTNGEAQ